MPNAIIDFPKGMEFVKQKPEIEVIVKNRGKVIYHNKAYACVMNMVQSETVKIETIDDIELEGDSQVFGCGNPIIQMFAINELQRKLKDVYRAGTVELARYIKDPKLKDQNAEYIKKLIEG